MRAAHTLFVDTLEPRTFLSTYYVSPSGSDTNAGSSSAPWKTLQKAGNVAAAGDTVNVLAGHYAGFNIVNSGSSAARLTFLAQSGAIIDAPVNFGGGIFGINGSGKSYITIQGFTITPQNGQAEWDDGIRLGGTPGSWVKGNIITGNVVHMRVVNQAATPDQLGIFASWNDGLLIEDNIASGGWDSGIYVSNSSKNYTIRGNEVYDVGGNGIHNNGDIGAGSPGINTNALIENNVIHDVGFGIGGQAISCDGVQNSRIQNNLIYRAYAKGISLYVVNSSDGSKNNVIANNTVITGVGSSAGVALRLADGSTGNVVFNNIFYNAASGSGHWPYEISENAASNLIIDRNVLMDPVEVGVSLATWRSWGFDQHSIVSNPTALFVNPAANDYHLKTASPAIDAGIATLNAKAAPTSDLEGSARPQGAGFDIGAYEFNNSGGDTTPPIISSVGTSNITSNGSTIAWLTNEASTTQVEYGTSTSYGSSTTLDPALVTNHSSALSDLTANTSYHYRVKSRDAAGNLATSSDFTFATTPTDNTAPTITSVAAGNITSGSSTITWATNESSNSQVEYGTTTSYGNATALDAALVMTHSVGLSGLLPNTLYHYRVKSADGSGNLGVSGDFTFRTLVTAQFPPGATAIWKLNESSGTTTVDSSGNSNTGTLTNGPTFVAGYNGNALHFDGVDDAVRVTRSASLEGAKVSIAAWVKLEGTQAQWATIVKKTYADDTSPVWGSYDLEISPSALDNRLGFFTGSTTGGDTLQSPAALPVNQWVHVAATYDPAAAQKRLYVNGQLVASSTRSTPLIYDTTVHGDLYLARDPGPGEAFRGPIDNVGVWGRALSAAEVTSLVNGSNNGGKLTKDPILNAYTPGGSNVGRQRTSPFSVEAISQSSKLDDLLDASA